jgi:hypothetical protein
VVWAPAIVIQLLEVLIFQMPLTTPSHRMASEAMLTTTRSMEVFAVLLVRYMTARGG